MKLAQTQTQQLSQMLQQKWDKKLRGRFALAPRDMHDTLDQSQYRDYNAQFDNFCSNYVAEELTNLATAFPPVALQGDVVSLIGIGLARGLGFIPLANQLGLRVKLYDVSEYALKLGEQVLQSPENIANYHRNSTELVEITGSEGEISFNSRLIVMPQFLQILPVPTMKKVMAAMRDHMQWNDCRLVIVHPLGNNDAVWGDTIPYQLADILAPLDRPGKPQVEVIRSQTHRYFGRHNYTAFTVARKER